jgi:hypothetical protein
VNFGSTAGTEESAASVPTPIGTSTQILSEKEVDALLAASDPPGTYERTSQPAREVRLTR